METYKGDHDDDGIPDYEDAQFCTATFQGVNGWDCADGLPDPSGDLDNDGLRNAIDPDFPNCGTTIRGACDGYDADLDGVPDYLDRDSDNDGISDLIEAGGTDVDGDGVIDDLTDTDVDGLADDYDNDDTDGSSGTSPCVNRPGCLQGVSTNPLLDTDNDGVTDNKRDTDGDGLADWIDIDADNDGIPDVVEVGGTDTDGDGFADNFVDLDKDGFNDIDDGQICTDSTAIDTATYVPASSNGVANGTNANGQPDGDVADLYSDGEEIVLDFGAKLPIGTRYVIHWKRRDYNNGNTTTISVQESESPNSGYSTHSVSPSTNSEEEIITTLLEVELTNTQFLKLRVVAGGDNDFEVDAVKYFYKEESCVVGNPILVTGPDGNNDGIPDSYPSDDTDGDGVLDHLDLDSDNDGIPDVVEVGGTDVDGDGRFDNQTDSDNDGLADDIDGDVGNNENLENTANALQLTGADTDGDGIPNSYPDNDTDGDGIRDQLDLDSDNDGIPDVVEQGGTDENGDGKADNYVDTDGDGFNDVVDGDVGNDGAENTANALTVTGVDGNNDGVPDTRPEGDLDQDGVFNFLDLDADNDGIMDVTEARGTDTNRDGLEDGVTDADNDGFNDNVDGDTDNSLALGTDTDGGQQVNATTLTEADNNNDGAPDSYPNDDFDGDGKLNYLDIDADNDGIVDNTEGQSTAGYIAPAGADADGDGINDAYDDSGNFGGNGAVSYVLSNVDGAENPDYLDLDSENDGISDTIEGHDTDGDGIADGTSPANTGLPGGTTDIDNDGLLDGYDNNTASTDPTNGGLEGEDHPDLGNPISIERDWREVPDADNDGVGDFIDIDDDNDGILDVDESPCAAPRIRFEADPDAYWTLDNTTDDATANNNDERSDGNAPGFSTVAIQGTHSANFNGTSNQIRYSRDGVFMEDTYTDVSFSAWIKPSSLTGERIIYEEGGSSHGLALWLNDNLLTFSTRVSSSQVDVVHQSTLSLDGLWHHVSATYAGGVMTVYLDGVASAVTAMNSTAIPSHAGDGGLGGEIGSSKATGITGNYSGLMDAVRYSNSEAWSASRIGFEAQRFCDSDGDGIADHLDLDSDNDGIPDIIEAGGVYTNEDGRVENDTNTDGDGWANTFDPTDGGTSLAG